MKQQEFPVDVLPRALQQYVREGAASLQCPPGFFATPIIVLGGAAIGTSRAMRVKGDWTELPAFTCALVGDPGDAKTPALNRVAAPVYRRQRLEKMAFDARMSEYEAEQRSRKQARDADPIPPPPTLPRWFTTDTTVEALAVLLNQNPRGLPIIRDELTGWVRGMDQYRARAGADRQFYLSAWNASSPHIVDRKSSTVPTMVNRPFLSVIGGLTPDMLNELRDERGREDGFLHRIVFEFSSGARAAGWTEAVVSHDAERAWSDAWDRLAALTPAPDGDPVVVDFTPAGRRAWIEWFNRHDAERGDADFPSHLNGPWVKLRAICARTALVIQLLHTACCEAASEAVDEASLRGATAIVEHWKNTVRRVYARLQASPQDMLLEKVRAWIIKKGGRAAPRDLARAGIPSIESTAVARKTLQDLHDRGHGVWENGEQLFVGGAA